MSTMQDDRIQSHETNQTYNLDRILAGMSDFPTLAVGEGD
jgi:hypothetical protein